MSNKRIHIFIEGRVQGVGFRWWCKRNAGKLGLTGWVRNLDDTRVELIAEGDIENLEKLLERIKTGPPLSEVNHTDISWEESTGEFKSFEVIQN